MTVLQCPACRRAGAATAGITACLALGLLASPLQAQGAGLPESLAASVAPAAPPANATDTAHHIATDAAGAAAALPTPPPWQLVQAAQPPLAPLVAPAGAQVAPRLPLHGSGDITDTAQPSALPDAPAQPSRPFNYALGLAYSISPSYAGSDERKSRLRPVLALQYGRFRLSSSRGSSVLRHGLDTRGSGASATLIERDRFNISAALRIDNGRDASDATRLAGLPEVRSTLRGRISMGYAITDRWSAGASVSQDLLGRSGGAQLNTGLQYALNLTPQTRFSVGLGAAFGDATFMRTQFGVPDSAPGMGSALAPFTPGAGLYSVDAGMGVMTALSRRWVAFGAITASQLKGDARRSPLTVRPQSYGATAGIAYRCCP